MTSSPPRLKVAFRSDRKSRRPALPQSCFLSNTLKCLWTRQQGCWPADLIGGGGGEGGQRGGAVTFWLTSPAEFSLCNWLKIWDEWTRCNFLLFSQRKEKKTETNGRSIKNKSALPRLSCVYSCEAADGRGRGRCVTFIILWNVLSVWREKQQQKKNCVCNVSTLAASASACAST